MMAGVSRYDWGPGPDDPPPMPPGTWHDFGKALGMVALGGVGIVAAVYMLLGLQWLLNTFLG